MTNEVAAVDPELDAISRRYLASLAARGPQEMTSPLDVRGLRAWSSVRRLLYVGVGALAAVGVAAGTLGGHHSPAAVTGTPKAATAAKPTLCPRDSAPKVPAGSTGAAFGAAVQQYDQWDAACGAAWKANLDVFTLDLASLPHVPGGGQILVMSPGYSTLPAAVAGADTIVVAKVVSVAQTDAGTTFNLAIEQTLKGPAGASLVLTGEGQLAPATMPPSGVAIQDAVGIAFPLPGARVVVMGKTVNGLLTGQPYSGLYFLENGKVRAQSDNPFGAGQTGTAEATFLNNLVATVKAG